MQTDCKSQSVHFTPLGRRKLSATFDGGFITSDAGALLLREVAGKSKLFERMAQAVPDPRNPALIEHDQQTMLAQRVLGIACGWEDLNDHHGLRIDPLMQMASEREVDADRPLASPATLCRLASAVSSAERRTASATRVVSSSRSCWSSWSSSRLNHRRRN